MIGTKLAHYEVARHLGSGGMGDVYEAADSKLGRSVAIKFLSEPFANDADRVSRFQREARVLAAPAVLFPTRIWGGASCCTLQQYDVTRDGRFLINVASDDAAGSPVTILLNWKSPGK